MRAASLRAAVRSETALAQFRRFLVAAAVLMAALWAFSRLESEPELVIVQGGEVEARASIGELGDEIAARRFLTRIEGRRRVRRAAATIELRTDWQRVRREFRRLRSDGGVLRVREVAVASRVNVPIAIQQFRNNCETAALGMLLASADRRVTQGVLQARLRRSGPLDPLISSDGKLTWGDPDRGFVGRVDGGGTHGGYGVYEKPIIELARQSGLKLERLNGADVNEVYDRLLGGRPVMVWIGLTEGPVLEWKSPEGRAVTGNFGEHTVVLTGISRDRLRVNDPLTGKRSLWSKTEFEKMWARLGSRAIATPSTDGSL